MNQQNKKTSNSKTIVIISLLLLVLYLIFGGGSSKTDTIKNKSASEKPVRNTSINIAAPLEKEIASRKMKLAKENTAKENDVNLSVSSKEDILKELKVINEKINKNMGFAEEAELHYQKAALYSRLKYHQQAVNSYKKSISLKPDNFNAWFNLGIVEVSRGEYNQSVEYFNEAIKIEPENFNAYYNRALSYLKMRQFNKASDDFDIVIKLDDDNYQSIYYKSVMLNNAKKYEQAKTLLKSSLQYVNSDKLMLSNIRYQIALAEYNMSNLKAALGQINQALSVNKNNHKFYYLRSLIYERLGDLSKSNSDKEKASQIELGNMLDK